MVLAPAMAVEPELMDCVLEKVTLWPGAVANGTWPCGWTEVTGSIVYACLLHALFLPSPDLARTAALKP